MGLSVKDGVMFNVVIAWLEGEQLQKLILQR